MQIFSAVFVGRRECRVGYCGEIIAKFDSQQDAATAMGAKNSANINNAVLGKQKTAYGYRWVKAIDYQPADKTN